MKKILFVCTGNTCRSPMAETIANEIFTRKHLETKYLAESAGLFAEENEPMTPYSIKALEILGYKANPHRSRLFYKDMIDNYVVIAGMSKGHKEYICDCDKVVNLGDYIDGKDDISDPFGGTQENYIKCAKDIEVAVKNLIETIIK